MTAEPQAAQLQSFYDDVGGEPTFRRIVARFYELVADDEILRPMYPEEDLSVRPRSACACSSSSSGEGPRRIRSCAARRVWGARHMPFRIARPHRDAWLRAMRVAIDDAGLATAHAERLWNQLETMAWNFTTHATPRKP